MSGHFVSVMEMLWNKTHQIKKKRGMFHICSLLNMNADQSPLVCPTVSKSRQLDQVLCRAGAISQLTNLSNTRILTTNYFDNLSIIFKTNMPDILCLTLIKSDDLLFLSHTKQNSTFEEPHLGL